MDMARMEPEQLAREISSWMSQMVREAGMKGVVTGLSGGVDSSLVAVLAKRASDLEVLGLILPCHSSPLDEEHARLLARKFEIEIQRIDLAPAYDELLWVLPAGDEVAAGNLKARLRMISWYHFAKLRQCLVAGAGNRSEVAVGYFTKYGDGGADILPLGNLLKTEVRTLAGHVGIPSEIIDKPPSAGLWEGQTDEEELGLTYEQLDAALIALEEGRTQDIPPSGLGRVREMMAGSEHKRAPIPTFRP